MAGILKQGRFHMPCISISSNSRPRPVRSRFDSLDFSIIKAVAKTRYVVLFNNSLVDNTSVATARNT